MDLGFTDAQTRFRQEVRDFMRNHVTKDLLADLEARHEEHSPTFHLRLADKGWIGMQWPTDVGGRARTEIEMAILMEEAGYFLAPMTGYLVASIAGGTIVHVGSEVQRRAYLPEIVQGRSLFALAYTEPDAGSDLASLSTRAVRTADGWALRGTKVFTSLAHEAQFLLVAARTTPSSVKHDGLTVFIVPTERPGIEITPIETLGGFRTNVVALADVPVGEDDVLGAVDGGWATLGAALDLERTGASRLGLCRRLLDLAWREVRKSDARTTHGAVFQRLADFEQRWVASRLLSYRAVWMVGNNRLPTSEAAMAKVVSTELAQEIASAVIGLIGPDALLGRGSGAPGDGLCEYAYRNAARFTVTAGTSEIQRNLISKLRLHLGQSR